MKNDAEILKEVQNILDWDSAKDATHITVEVKNGVVKLIGSVHSLPAKWMAKEAVKHIGGIKEIKNKLKITPAH